MNRDQDPLSRLFAQTATTGCDPAFAARIEHALAPHRRRAGIGPGVVVAALIKPLVLASVVGGGVLVAALVLEATPFGGLAVAAAALVAVRFLRERLA